MIHYYYAIHHFRTNLYWQKKFIPYGFFGGDIIILQKMFSKERSPLTISIWAYFFPVFICVQACE